MWEKKGDEVMFFDFFTELKRQTALSAVVTIVLGLILLLAPKAMVAGVLAILGWTVMILGCLTIASAVLSGGDVGGLIVGILQIVAGGWLVRHPYQLTALVGVIVAGFVLIHAVRDIQYAVDAHRAGAANWLAAAISGGVTLLLGLLVLINPVGSAMSLLSFAGICLLIDGVSDLVMLHRMGELF